MDINVQYIGLPKIVYFCTINLKLRYLRRLSDVWKLPFNAANIIPNIYIPDGQINFPLSDLACPSIPLFYSFKVFL